MSANPTDDALARLNYFNGQRLAASDLRTEQAHHVAMRRLLNRSLYSAGIVTGLAVEPDRSFVHRVMVRSGLAFDHLGREIYVPADMSVPVNGAPSVAPGVVVGNLLAVSYRENRAQPVLSGCTVGARGSDLAWGAPTRVIADAVFEVLETWPAADAGKVVLAQIEFSATCEVVRCVPGVRKYAVPVKAGKTRTLALAGDGDVAPQNPKVLHFHIADGLPERAQLYLRGGVMSSLWYSELAQHGHDLNIVVARDSLTVDLDHTHSVADLTTESAGLHRHGYWKDGKAIESGGLEQADPSGGPTADNSLHVKDDDSFNALFDNGSHSHTVSFTLGPPDPLQARLSPDFGNSSLGVTGMAPGVRQGQKPYTYFKELKVKLDGVAVTDKILEQLTALTQLGVGESTTPDSDVFVTAGTPAIDLLLLGIDLLPGAHTLEFVVPAGKGGGKLFYALYID